MLESFYNTFGFFGSVFIAFLGFAVLIFWIAGIAGIANMPENENKDVKLIISVLFPPYPLIWMFYDIYRDRKLMQEEE